MGDYLVIPTLDSVGELKGKKVLLRVDFNSPIDPSTGKLMDYTRIRSHVVTIKELVKKGASVVIISHQGRPGMDDFTSLEEHSKVLSKISGLNVEFIEDVMGPEARRVIKNLNEPRVIMLDNVRFLSEEMIEESIEAHANSFLVRRLAPLFDIYVNDAFATAHRSHASIVGFPAALPSYAGRVMEREVKALAKIRDPSLSPKVYFLGGGKVRDTLRAIEYILSRDESALVLTAGLLAMLLLAAKGDKLGAENYKVLEKKGLLSLLPRAEKILYTYRGRIRLPLDFKIEYKGKVEVASIDKIHGVIRDIGPETVEIYGSIMREAKVIVMKGPAGVIEDPRFRDGTRGVIMEAANSNASVVIGGGHLNAIAEELKVSEKPNVHLSTGGGALVMFLSGEKLPALEALSYSAKKFNIRGVVVK